MLDMHSYRSHRDVKPANVMVSWQGGQVLVTLIDFAGSRLHHQGKDLASVTTLCGLVSALHHIAL